MPSLPMGLGTQGALNAPATAGFALATRTDFASRKAQVTSRRTANQLVDFALTSWFEVTVKHPDIGTGIDLGKWSGCRGLGLSIKTEPFLGGGNNHQPVTLPGQVDYPNVTLERPVVSRDSTLIQGWLSKVVGNWVESGADPVTYGCELTITLYNMPYGNSAHKTKSASWVLKNAIPISWTGPTLSNGSGGIATEQIVFAHSGFLRNADTNVTHRLKFEALNLSDGATLNKAENEDLEFLYNPNKVTVTRMLKSDNAGGAKKKGDDSFIDDDKTGYTIGELRILGAAMVDKTQKTLAEWLMPVKGTSTDDKTEKTFHRPLRMTMGAKGISAAVILKKAEVSYSRFTSESVPCRATVTVVVEVVPQEVANQNPLSETPEPGKVHTLVAGDSLAGLARSTYGDPNDWRAIAEANRCEDPLRMRTGRTLYLPNAG